MISLEARLNRGLAAVLILVFTSLWVLGSCAIRRVVEHEMVTRLEHDGDSLLASLEIDQDGQARFASLRLGLIYEQPYSGHYFVIHWGGRVFRSQSLGSEAFSAISLPPGKQLQYHYDGPEAQPLLVLARGIKVQEQELTLTVAEELTAIEHEIEELSLAYLALILIVLGIAIRMSAK